VWQVSKKQDGLVRMLGACSYGCTFLHSGRPLPVGDTVGHKGEFFLIKWHLNTSFNTVTPPGRHYSIKIKIKQRRCKSVPLPDTISNLK